MSDFAAELALAEEAAGAAGTYLRDAFAASKPVLSQEGRDIKLEADREAERRILERLNGSNYAVLAEESGEHGAVDSTEPFWVVDPLDGTMNFSRGIPVCSVSIALCRGTDPLAGVVFDFLNDRLYAGTTAGGARLNGAETAVSEIADPAKGILATGFPSQFDFTSEAANGLMDLYARFKKVRMIGSAAMSLAYVAAGCVEAYTEERIMLWDVAAGLALVKAAGGVIDVRQTDTPWVCNVRAACAPSIWETAAV